MTTPSRLRSVPWRGLLLLALAIPVAAADPNVNAQAAALQEFQTRCNQYIALRARLAGRQQPLSLTADARQLTARQEALATAIKTARAKAKRGDLIPPLVAQLITRAVRDDFRRRNPTAKMALVEELSNATAASLINKTYPANAALPTVPPLLLSNLPRLPDNLQYRFVGRDVVILDGDVQVVVDYIPSVLPPR